VAVDDEVAVVLLDDDGGLLTGFSQRSDQPALAAWVADPEAFQAAVGIWSFARKAGCC